MVGLSNTNVDGALHFRYGERIRASSRNLRKGSESRVRKGDEEVEPIADKSRSHRDRTRSNIIDGHHRITVPSGSRRDLFVCFSRIIAGRIKSSE
jgi:hypothetical protein